MSKKPEVRLIQLEEAHKTIMDKLVSMDERLVGMDHVIRGNGRPGLVAKTEVIEQRLKGLEGNRRDWKNFIAATLGGGLVAGITMVMQHFIH